MGHDVELFTKPDLEDEFLCFICKKVLNDPVLAHPCEHAFCGLCITGKTRRCPVDNLRISRLKKAQRPYLNLVGNLELKCIWAAQGCDAIGDINEHNERCEHNPENQRECDEGCGAIVSQYVRRIGAHSCNEYLKEQLKLTREQLEACQLELERASSPRKRSQGQDRDAGIQDQGQGAPGPYSKPVPGSSKRFRISWARNLRPKIVCIRKWGASLRSNYYDDIIEVVGVAAAVARGFPSLQDWRHWYIDRLRGEVTRVIPPNLTLAGLLWTTKDNNTDFDLDPVPDEVEWSAAIENNIQGDGDGDMSGLELEVDNKFCVKILLNGIRNVSK